MTDKPEIDLTQSFNIFKEDGHIRPMEDLKDEILRIAIHHYDGKMSEVARRLKIGRSTLYRNLPLYQDQGEAKLDI